MTRNLLRPSPLGLCATVSTGGNGVLWRSCGLAQFEANWKPDFGIPGSSPGKQSEQQTRGFCASQVEIGDNARRKRRCN
jgi:hypothetical protein